MGATRFFKKRKYTQKKCQQALEEGFCVGFPGKRKPRVDKITIPIKVKKVFADGVVIGYNINRA